LKARHRILQIRRQVTHGKFRGREDERPCCMSDPSPRGRLRRPVALLAALVLLAIVGVCWVRSPSPQEPALRWRETAGGDHSGWNVVLVTVDTLRADRLGCYGYPRIETPTFDTLAREGVRFTNASTTVPFTLPAHSSIMTGTYPPYHGVRENVGYHLDKSIPTLAELLVEGGRASAGFVSTFVLDARWGIGRGFGHYFDDFDLQDMGADMGSVQRDGKETVAAAAQWLRQRGPGPFFLWLHLYDPHDPYDPPEPFRSQYPGRPYDGEVAYADSLVGELRQTLEAEGLLESSLVVLTGDHGEGLRSHGEGFHGFFNYDSTVHVPLIVRFPEQQLAGQVVEDAVSHVDLLPTILEALDLSPPSSVQGRSLLPLLLGQKEPEERAVYSESMYALLHYGWSPIRSIRTTRYKYIATPRPELYDLIEDPAEAKNLFAQKRGTARSLRQRLTALRSTIEVEGRESEEADLDEETLAQLRALGYVAGRGEVADLDDEAERADPKDKIELHQRIMMAQSFLGKGESERAESQLREVLERDSEIIDPYQMLGQIRLQKEDFEGALGHFKSALELDGEHKGSLFGLAHAYDALGKKEEALLGFEHLLTFEPTDSKAALAAAKIHVEAQRLGAAREILEGATASENPPALVLSQLGEVLALEGRKEEAQGYFERAITANEDLVQPRFHLAVLYEEQSQLDRAIKFYEETIERGPKHFQAQFNLGRLVGARGEVDRQRQLYEAAIASNPEFVRGYYYLAKLLMDSGGDLARAEVLTRDGLARDPQGDTGPLGFFLLADILNRTRRPAEARQAVAKGREIQARS
jgi:arylsulfatase A-like enzyme/Tfp pilus assembly protein PilF